LTTIRFKRLDPRAQAPRYAHGPMEDAGMDLCSIEAGTIQPGQQVNFDTGIAIELPSFLEGFKYGIGIPHGLGTIDPGYRGCIKVALVNHGQMPFEVAVGDRIAQLVINRYEPVMMLEAEDELSVTTRNTGGFGSSGK
jgi:dUTP pyrophosphatase